MEKLKITSITVVQYVLDMVRHSQDLRIEANTYKTHKKVEISYIMHSCRYPQKYY